MSPVKVGRSENSRGQRTYSWKGESYWSVTTILSGGLPKPALINWAKKYTAEYAVEHFDAFAKLVEDDKDGAIEWLKGAAYRDRDMKADLGSLVHDSAEAYKLGKPHPPWPAHAQKRMESFEAFLADYEPEIIAAEAPIYNRSERYAGTLDTIGKIGPRTGLWDYKTGKGIYPEVGLQLAAYRNAEFLGLPDGSEALMPKVDFAAVVHLTDEGYEFTEVDAGEEMFRSFLYVREVFRFQQELSKNVLRGPVLKGDEATQAELDLAKAVAS